MALALVGRPRLVLLDEPTTGLDVEARHILWQALRDYHADGATVLLTSHYLEEIEALAERVVVIGGGRVLADDTLRAVLGLVGLRRVIFAVPRRGRRSTWRGCPARPAHSRRATGAGPCSRRTPTAWCAPSSSRPCRSGPGGARRLAGGGVPHAHAQKEEVVR